MTAEQNPSSNDPGLTVLVAVLRFQGIGTDPEHVRNRMGMAAIGRASGTVVSNSVGVLDAGSTASASVLGGSWMTVASGGVGHGYDSQRRAVRIRHDNRKQINAGGYDLVSSGGVDIGAHIRSGGVEVVSSGGVASSATATRDWLV
jgi:autotransporter passenger strand-loop-strand repeat protein